MLARPAIRSGATTADRTGADRKRDCSRKCNLASLHSGPRRRTPVNAGNRDDYEASAERYTKVSGFGLFERPKMGVRSDIMATWYHGDLATNGGVKIRLLFPATLAPSVGL